MELRADIFSCRNNSAIRVDANMTEPLQYLFLKIPSLIEMPHIATVMQARKQMIERIHMKSSDQLGELTKPIISDMRTIRPSLRNRFTAITTW